MITPTFKVKRNVAKKTYLKEIETMYAEGLPEPTR
jgi:long-subunit acyl-CoA synthetase (AMP-forming)